MPGKNGKTPLWFTILAVTFVVSCLGGVLASDIKLYGELAEDKSDLRAHVSAARVRYKQTKAELVEIKVLLKEQAIHDKKMSESLIRIEARLPD